MMSFGIMSTAPAVPFVVAHDVTLLVPLVKRQLVGLTMLGVINSAIGAYYYLRVIVVMYMKEPQGEAVPLKPLSAGVSAVLVLSAVTTLYLGILPGAVLTSSLRQRYR